jgi:DNA-binding LacI/PurR family transcriptional regulator
LPSRAIVNPARNLGLQPQIRLIPGGLSEQDGEQAAAQLSADTPPTAVAAFNDNCAAGLIAAARGRGVPIPEKLSLVGYDDSHIASLASVALTIAQDAPTLAGAALDLALRHTEDKNPEPSQVTHARPPG